MVFRILNKFPVSENGTHVALGLVSEEPSVLLHFNGLDPLPQSNSRIRDTLQLVRVKVKAQLNRLDLALEMAYRMFQRKNGAREHARKVREWNDSLRRSERRTPFLFHKQFIYLFIYLFIYIICWVWYSAIAQAIEHVVHARPGSSISLLLSTSVWVLLSPAIERQETRPTA